MKLLIDCIRVEGWIFFMAVFVCWNSTDAEDTYQVLPNNYTQYATGFKGLTFAVVVNVSLIGFCLWDNTGGSLNTLQFYQNNKCLLPRLNGSVELITCVKDGDQLNASLILRDGVKTGSLSVRLFCDGVNIFPPSISLTVKDCTNVNHGVVENAPAQCGHGCVASFLCGPGFQNKTGSSTCGLNAEFEPPFECSPDVGRDNRDNGLPDFAIALIVVFSVAIVCTAGGVGYYYFVYKPGLGGQDSSKRKRSAEEVVPTNT